MPSGARALAVPHGARTAPLVVAHRGAWDPAPQNSLESLEAAIALGCDAVEIDVRRTADGRLAVLHDARIGGRAVGRLPLHQLQARLSPGQAPLLDDVLARAAGRILVDVELKEDGYVEAAMATITRHLRPEQFVVTSFREEILAQVRAQAPAVRIGLLLGARRLRDLDRRLAAVQVDFLAPHMSLATTTTFAWAQRHGLPIWTWTPNDPRILRALVADPRVQAIITDRPARALALVRTEATETAGPRRTLPRTRRRTGRRVAGSPPAG